MKLQVCVDIWALYSLSFRSPSPCHCARATQLLLKKCCSSGKPLATLCPIWLARDLNLRSSAPEINALLLDQLAYLIYKFNEKLITFDAWAREAIDASSHSIACGLKQHHCVKNAFLQSNCTLHVLHCIRLERTVSALTYANISINESGITAEGDVQFAISDEFSEPVISVAIASKLNFFSKTALSFSYSLGRE